MLRSATFNVAVSNDVCVPCTVRLPNIVTSSLLSPTAASNEVLNASAVTCLAAKDALVALFEPETVAAVNDLIKVPFAPNEPETPVAVKERISVALAPNDPDTPVAVSDLI